MCNDMIWRLIWFTTWYKCFIESYENIDFRKFELLFPETQAQTVESRVKDQKRQATLDGLDAERGSGDKEAQKASKFLIFGLFDFRMDLSVRNSLASAW